MLILHASLVAQRLKSLPAMREIQVQFLGREDPLEKGMATHSSILAWRILWTEQPVEQQSMTFSPRALPSTLSFRGKTEECLVLA